MRANFLIFIFILVVLPVFIGLCFLEWVLAKKNKWLGLILPFANISLYLIILMNMLMDVNVIATTLLTTVLMNIPTVVYLIIFFIARNTVNKKFNISEENKMRIEDLD